MPPLPSRALSLNVPEGPQNLHHRRGPVGSGGAAALVPPRPEEGAPGRDGAPDAIDIDLYLFLIAFAPHLA